MLVLTGISICGTPLETSGVQTGSKTRPNAAEASKIEIATRSQNALLKRVVPQRPPEVPQVRFYDSSKVLDPPGVGFHEFQMYIGIAS